MNFFQEAINRFYADDMYLLREGKIFVNLKCLILLKTFSLWLSGCLLDTFQFPSFAEQLPLLATAQSAKPQEGFAQICPLGQVAPKDPFCFPGRFREERSL